MAHRGIMPDHSRTSPQILLTSPVKENCPTTQCQPNEGYPLGRPHLNNTKRKRKADALSVPDQPRRAPVNNFEFRGSTLCPLPSTPLLPVPTNSLHGSDFSAAAYQSESPRSDNTQHIEQMSLRSTQNGLFNPRIPASAAHSAQSTNSNLYKPPIMPTNNQDAEPLSSHQDVFLSRSPCTRTTSHAPHVHCSCSSLLPQTMICSTCAGTDFCMADSLE